MLSINKVFEFEAAHFLPEHLGKCKHWHGHSYKLEVEVSVEDDMILEDGMILDFTNLKDIVNTAVIDVLDHSDLNKIMENPTAENIVFWIINKLDSVLSNECIKLTRTRLWETSSSFVEWKKGSWKIYE